MKARDRRLIAYHEAGHAVAARLLGIAVVEIDMIDLNVTTPSAGYSAGDDPAAKARGVYSDLMAVLAGSAAQRRAGYADSNNEDDDVNAGSCAGMLARLEMAVYK